MASGLQAALAVVTRPAGGVGVRAHGASAPTSRCSTRRCRSPPSARARCMATGEAPPVPDVLTGGLACYGVYRCADGLELAVGALEPQFFARGRRARRGRRSWRRRSTTSPGRTRCAAGSRSLFATRPRDEWLALLEDDQTCVTPVRSSAEALADPDLAPGGRRGGGARRRPGRAAARPSPGSRRRRAARTRRPRWAPHTDGAAAPSGSTPRAARRRRLRRRRLRRRRTAAVGPSVLASSTGGPDVRARPDVR